MLSFALAARHLTRCFCSCIPYLFSTDLDFIGRGPKCFFQECPTVRILNPHCQDIVRSGQIYDLGNSGRKASGSDVKTLGCACACASLMF